MDEAWERVREYAMKLRKQELGGGRADRGIVLCGFVRNSKWPKGGSVLVLPEAVKGGVRRAVNAQ